jgi:hypothetical protein
LGRLRHQFSARDGCGSIGIAGSQGVGRAGQEKGLEFFGLTHAIAR